jgi:hypothetical protein
MSTEVKIPSAYTITLAGGADLDLDNVRIKEIPVIRLDTAIKEVPKIELDLGLDDVRIRELPKIDADIGIKPTRVHMPMHTQLCVSVLGIKLLKISVCGENMMITEPYRPRQTERCE